VAWRGVAWCGLAVTRCRRSGSAAATFPWKRRRADGGTRGSEHSPRPSIHQSVRPSVRPSVVAASPRDAVPRRVGLEVIRGRRSVGSKDPSRASTAGSHRLITRIPVRLPPLSLSLRPSANSSATFQPAFTFSTIVLQVGRTSSMRV